jgi:DNA (cytosine-5)-methyltransferase 1
MKQQTFVAGCLTAWDTQQQRIYTPESTAPTLTGADGGGGRNPGDSVLGGILCRSRSNAGGIGYQQEISPTLKASESGTNMVPSVLCLNDQGGSIMDVSHDVTGTLRGVWTDTRLL